MVLTGVSNIHNGPTSDNAGSMDGNDVATSAVSSRVPLLHSTIPGVLSSPFNPNTSPKMNMRRNTKPMESNMV